MPEFAIRIADEVRQCVVDTVEILACKSTGHVVVSTHAEEHGIELIEKFIERPVFADPCIQYELDTHTLEYLASLAHNLLFKFEGWDAVGQQAANFRVRIKYNRANSIAGQHIGSRKSCRACPDDTDALACVIHVRHIGPPTLADRLVCNVTLDAPDRYRAIGVIQRAGTFTKPILWTNPPTYLGQGIRLV